jgi:hypothetical protein
MECPLCGCQNFYVKNSDDEFETYEFSVAGGHIAFDSAETGAVPEVQGGTETYCTRCSWHGRMDALKK